MDKMDLVKLRFECNLVLAAREGRIPPGIAIISLCHAHGWRSNPKAKQSNDHYLKVTHVGALPEQVIPGASAANAQSA
jgi:hypothetical protein